MSLIPPENLTSPAGYVSAFIASVFIIGIAKGGFGGGIGMLAVPVMLQVLPPKTAVPLMVPILVLCDLCTIRHFPHDWDKRGIALIVPGTLIGFVIGFVFLDRFRAADINLAIGLLTLFFLVLTWSGAGNRPLFQEVSRLKGTVVGIGCGFSTVVAHSAGAIVNMFFLARRLDKEYFIGTTARLYFGINLLKVPIFALNPNPDGPTFGWHTLLWTSWALPLCPLAVWIGVWMQRHFSQETFRMLIYLTLLLMAGKLIYDSIVVYLA